MTLLSLEPSQEKIFAPFQNSEFATELGPPVTLVFGPK